MIDLEAFQQRNESRATFAAAELQIHVIGRAIAPMLQAIVDEIDALLAEIKRLHAADEVRARDISRLTAELRHANEKSRLKVEEITRIAWETLSRSTQCGSWRDATEAERKPWSKAVALVMDAGGVASTDPLAIELPIDDQLDTSDHLLFVDLVAALQFFTTVEP